MASCLGVLVFASELVGSGTVVKEGLTTPISAKCAEVLMKVADPKHDKILADVPSRNGVGLPVSVAAQEDDPQLVLAKVGNDLLQVFDQVPHGRRHGAPEGDVDHQCWTDGVTCLGLKASVLANPSSWYQLLGQGP